MRKFLLLALIASPALAVPPTITPSIPRVYVSSSIGMNANQAVTWSLAAGSTGTINSVTGLYTAPGPVKAKNVWLGCPALPNDHVYNTRIDALSVDASTTTYYHSVLTAQPINFEISFPENLYTNSTPQTAMLFHYTTGANGNFPLLPWPDIGAESGLFTETAQVDQHILGMNKDICQASEIYQLRPTDPSAVCGFPCNSASGVKYSDDYTLTQGVDAAGMYLAPLALRFSELRACTDGHGPINHALRFTMPNGYLTGMNVWPAVAFTNEPGKIPYGKRFRLKSTFPVAGSPTAQCIITALKNYGMFMTDGGMSNHIQTMADAGGDFEIFDVLTASMPYMTGLNSDNFEAVDESSLQDTTAASPAYHSGRVNPTNGTVTPDTFATVIATNGGSETATMPIIIQPVTIGVDKIVGYSFMAGAPATQLNVWVNGAVDKTFSCSMSPTLGSLTSGGLYTPPATATVRSTTTVTCVPTADATASVYFPVLVYPNDGIRQHMSNGTNVDYGPDANGKTWYAERGAFYRLPGSASGNCDFSYLPGSPWDPAAADIALYYHCEYFGNDIVERFNVPNGTYQIRLMFGIGGTTPFARETWVNVIDSQGSVYSSSMTTTMTGDGPWTELGLTGQQLDLYDLVGAGANATPGAVTLTKTVTDNNLYFAIRKTRTSAANPANVLTAFSIEQIAGPAAPTKGFSGGFTLKGGGTFR